MPGRPDLEERVRTLPCGEPFTGVSIARFVEALSGSQVGASTAETERWSSWEPDGSGTELPASSGGSAEALATAGVQTYEFEVERSDGLSASDTVVVEVESPADSDGDGVFDHRDVCVLVADADQRETSGDGYGNACDADYDDDGVVSISDTSVFAEQYQGLAPYDPSVDHDSDGDVDDRDYLFHQQGYSLAEPGPSALACAGSAPCP